MGSYLRIGNSLSDYFQIKIFSGASTEFGDDVNENVSFVDAGMPGMLPTLNMECVHQAVKTGLGLNAVINKYSEFSRKNYFYADLPQGYQITQFVHPIVGEGAIDIDLADGTTKTIRIERMHIEQDAGKSIHDIDPKRSFIDLNRAGVGLMEIVNKAGFQSTGRSWSVFYANSARFSATSERVTGIWMKVLCGAMLMFLCVRSVQMSLELAAR